LFKEEEYEMTYQGDLVALEDLKNNSICIKTNDGIRNIINGEDLNNLTVYVSNVVPLNDELKIIKKGKMVRYKNVKIFG
jgi:hypothetical protein